MNDIEHTNNSRVSFDATGPLYIYYEALPVIIDS
jgi:hypothetical protein